MSHSAKTSLAIFAEVAHACRRGIHIGDFAPHSTISSRAPWPLTYAALFETISTVMNLGI
ncbi:MULTISPECIES: hypothetical protein [Mumia]|uniref:Uncharacterized protein n=1 Tax=Mumia xiangluensis TaxID=1678900 RepID=A0ABW1QPZ6_9ACTN|nr:MULTISPECIES: hypothetical protein [Mumia]